jgi:hypothetical protein
MKSATLGILMTLLIASAATGERGGNGNHWGWYKGSHDSDGDGHPATAAATPAVIPATPTATPEIDAGALRTGLLLLAGGLVVLRDRRRRP